MPSNISLKAFESRLILLEKRIDFRKSQHIALTKLVGNLIRTNIRQLEFMGELAQRLNDIPKQREDKSHSGLIGFIHRLGKHMIFLKQLKDAIVGLIK